MWNYCFATTIKSAPAIPGTILTQVPSQADLASRYSLGQPAQPSFSAKAQPKETALIGKNPFQLVIWKSTQRTGFSSLDSGYVLQASSNLCFQSYKL